METKKRYLLYISQNYSYAILRPIQALIIRRGDEVRWFLEGDEVSASFLQKDEQELHTITEINQWNPDVVFVPGNVVPSFIPGIKVAIFHGFNTNKRSDNKGHFNIRGCFDLYCTQGPNTTKKFQQLALKYGYFQVAETGWPTLDPLFYPNTHNIYKEENDSRPTILMCSTFTEKLSCAETLYPTIKALSENGKWRWLVQFHPKMKQKTVDKYQQLQNENIQFVETDNILPLLQAADVMLCDTSSVIYMFLLQHKPVVTFRNQAPKAHMLNIDNPDQVEQALELILTKPKELMQHIESFCQDTHPYRDGKSAERVLFAADKMLSQGRVGLKRKPLNWIRQLKLRYKLNYWKVQL